MQGAPKKAESWAEQLAQDGPPDQWLSHPDDPDYEEESENEPEE